jgi:aconitate hydratase
MRAPKDNLLLRLCAVIHDPVTTTDELIPSGETSSYRSNPLRLSEFALSRRCPDYVKQSKAVAALEESRVNSDEQESVAQLLVHVGGDPQSTTYGSCIFAEKPGDGSAREQAASCQKVLGGFANICYEYATKRYRSNCINWGLFPFTIDRSTAFPYAEGDHIYIPGLRDAIAAGQEKIPAQILTSGGKTEDITLVCGPLTDEERQILLDGCLMNYYAAGHK